jgi:glutamine---fructose-6-phosphate transaminase (isomerizing)
MLTREATSSLLTHAGPEIGVASTKAFTTQLVALALLALAPRTGAGTLAEACREHLAHLPVPHAVDGARCSSDRRSRRLSRALAHARRTSSTWGGG